MASGKVIVAVAVALQACGGGGAAHRGADPCQAAQPRLAPGRSESLRVLPATTAAGAAAELRAAGLSPAPWSGLPPSEPVYRCTFTTPMSRTDLHPVQFFVDAALHSSAAPN
jgi:hypothetical protein